MHLDSHLMETRQHSMNCVACQRGYTETRLAISLLNVFSGINQIQWRRGIGTVAGGSGTKLKYDNGFILINNDLCTLIY
ncbi:Uncharacterised protein [Escherichia coli]|nr:Uncharacterised protein [Escherichia coli]